MAKRTHNTAETRHDLIESGSNLFSEVGFAAARTEEIVAMTGLTRGALYHHFGSKKGLFLAIVEGIQTQLAKEVSIRAVAAASTGGAVDGLRAGFQTYLDFALRDDVRRILLVDGPAVLGWEKWHEIDLRFAYGATRTALDRAMRAGEIAEVPLDELTSVLLGAVTQAALELGRFPNRPEARQKFGKVIDLLIENLRT